MGMPGHWELLLLLIIVLIIFGPKKLPALAQAIGKSVRELKNGMQGLNNEMKDAMDEKPEPPENKASETPEESEARPANHSTQN